jgi:hypothetical protein
MRGSIPFDICFARALTVGFTLAWCIIMPATAQQDAVGVRIHAAVEVVRWAHSAGAYSLEQPVDWGAHEQGLRTNIGSKDGLVPTERGGYRTIYGVILAVVDDPLSGTPDRTLAAASQTVFEGIVKRNAHLRVASPLAQTERLAGGQAYRAVAEGISPVTGHPERAEVICRELDDGHLLYMIQVCPEAACNELAPTFRRMRESLKVPAAN